MCIRDRPVGVLHRAPAGARGAARRARRHRGERGAGAGGDRVAGARSLAPDAGRGDPARMSALLEARALRKSYLGGDGRPIDVLLECDLSVSRGEFVAVTGASGTGKSTLLHLLGALDRPNAGSVALDGIEYAACTADALAALRNRKIG